MRLLFLAIIVVLLSGIVLFDVSDTAISVADTNMPDNETTTNINKASNSSASASITITMYAVAE